MLLLLLSLLLLLLLLLDFPDLLFDVLELLFLNLLSPSVPDVGPTSGKMNEFGVYFEKIDFLLNLLQAFCINLT